MKNRVHLICNAHLDPVWQWRWTEGCSEAMATFRNAVEIIREYPELIFNHNEAILYQWVQKYDAGLFKEIRELVAEKRWFIAGGWYLQPDVNLPPYENLVRHIRYGRDYFRSEFGVEPRVAYNFDSFGHPAGLPELLREYGYELYIHQRPEKEFLNLPGSLYQWKGLNGVTIPAYRIEIGLYHTERKNISRRLEEATSLALELDRDVALFWGLGDHGGGATRTDLETIRMFTAQESRVEFIHSTTDRFYESIKPILAELPVYEGSLQRVFTGCYTSLARVKRRAVESSAAAVQAERLANIPAILMHGNPAEALTDIWKDILFNDFHDILPGSCTEPAEQDALDLYGRAMENIRRLNMGSVTAFNRSSEPLKAHIPVTLFNSNPALTTFPVEFECMSDYRPFWEGEWVLKLFDRQGNEIPSQEEQPAARLPFHRWRRKISFLARNLGPGIHHFYLKPIPVADGPANPAGTETVGGSSQESTIAGKHAGQSQEISFIEVTDTADSWGTGTWAWREVTGRFKKEGPERIIGDGPVRTIRESILTCHQSRIIMHRIDYQDWPVTEYKIRIHWNEEQKRLKLVIPAKWPGSRLIGQIPGGFEEFPDDGQEHVHGSWLTLESPAAKNTGSETRRLHIVHSGLHGFDFDGREIRLSVLRSAAYCHEQGYDLDNGRTHAFMDLGIHEIYLAVWAEADGDHGKSSDNEYPAGPGSIAEYLHAPPLVWPHLPIG
jgi:alpha-mannosidase